MQTMQVSVAMCTYNGERYLSEQLRSIHEQTLQPAELVVCDDRSSDNTRSVVEVFRQTVRFPVKLHVNPVKLGSTANFAQCIRLCNGEAIALCDQDDRWHPDKLAVCAEALRRDSSLGGVFSNANLMDEAGVLLSETLWDRVFFDRVAQQIFLKNPARSLTQRDLVTGAALVFRTEQRSRLLPISPEWVHDGWIAFLLATISRLQPLPQLLVTYRLPRSQQVGLTVVPWQAHLHTTIDAAITAHLTLASRYQRIEERLAELQAHGEFFSAEVSTRLSHKISHEQTRAHLLQLPQLLRIFPALTQLRGYFEYSKGLRSLLRDLTHQSAAKM